MKGHFKVKGEKEQEQKRHSIGRQVNIGNGSDRINEIYERMSKEESFKKVLLYDNLSDDSFLNNYFLGTVYASNPRLFSSLSIANPNKEKLRESFLAEMREIQRKYGTDINVIIEKHLASLAAGEAVVAGDIANKVFTSIRVHIDSDLMLIAFMVGHYLQMTINNEADNK